MVSLNMMAVADGVVAVACRQCRNIVRVGVRFKPGVSYIGKATAATAAALVRSWLS
jgi:hypothetical protein